MLARENPNFHPQSFEDAQRILLPQVQSLQHVVAETPRSLRGSRVVFEATVLPNYLANSYFPRELFEVADLVPVGTRATQGPYVTKQHEPEERPAKKYLVAGDERSIQKVISLLEAGGVERGRRAAARDELRQFTNIRLSRVDEVVRQQVDDHKAQTGTWEAVLHRAIDEHGRETDEERALVFARWVAWVRQIGGDVASDFRRTIHGLTFVPAANPGRSR